MTRRSGDVGDRDRETERQREGNDVERAHDQHDVLRRSCGSMASDTAVSDELLLEPFRYLCAHPGKQIRSQLIDAFNHWLHVPADKLAVIKDAIEMLHTASLLYACVPRRACAALPACH